MDKRNQKHEDKIFAPVIITIWVVGQMLVTALIIFLMAFVFKLPAIVCGIGVVIILALGGVMIKVCLERIKEIRSGEEDDLSQY